MVSGIDFMYVLGHTVWLNSITSVRLALFQDH